MSDTSNGLAVWLLVPGVFFCVPPADQPVTLVTGRPACELRLQLEESRHRATAPIVGHLVMKNLGPAPIVIVKPLFPTVWQVRVLPDPSSRDAGQTWEGSVLVGTTDPRHQRAYAASDYVTIAPGKTYAHPLDIAWILRNQRSRIPVGVYELQLWYRPHPKAEEERELLASFAPEVASNVVRVVIIGEDE